jgi:carbonic anhydrase
MGEIDDLLEAAWARPDELAAPELGPQPRRKVALVTCMDARIDAFHMLGIERGDANVIRNAGGLITEDVLRSLSASQRLLGTEAVIVVMHDGCGLCGASDEEFAEQLLADGVSPLWRLGAFANVEATLAFGLARLRSSPELIAKDEIRGFVFNPDDGSLREVAALAPADSAERS